MTKQRTRSRPAHYAPWLAGLALCVPAATAEAQERPWSPERAVEDSGEPPRVTTDPRDPDLVRAGVHPTLAGALAAGVTFERNGAADFDGDGRADLLLTVAPRRDPYPFNHAPGLVLALDRAAGWSATVVARRWQPERAPDRWSDRYAWAPPVVGPRAALLAVDDLDHHDNDHGDWFENRVSFVRVDRDGALWWVGRGEDSHWYLPDGCSATRYRFVGPWTVRGDARGCRPIRLERPAAR